MRNKDGAFPLSLSLALYNQHLQDDIVKLIADNGLAFPMRRRRWSLLG